jgi:hypothetical protein
MVASPEQNPATGKWSSPLLGRGEGTAPTGSEIFDLGLDENEWTAPPGPGYVENSRKPLEPWERNLVTALADLVMADLLQSQGGRFS